MAKMVLKLSMLHILGVLVYTVSVDCPDVINLSEGLNLGLTNPRLMKSLRVDCCNGYEIGCISGRVDYVDFFGSRLTGVINMTALPRMMTYLDLSYNKISGIIQGYLPSTLTMVYINNNMITGALPDVSSSNLDYFHVENNYQTHSNTFI
eukprot:NODE_646_length_5582_cov_0.573044.p4 type:complete len:150 gc:universal NODE_646_length_5582_cov_0.573044:4211-4660(+)